MIDHFIEELQPGKQLVPVEWRPLVYKLLLWQVTLLQFRYGLGEMSRRLDEVKEISHG